MKTAHLKILTVFLFLFLAAFGLFLARHKPLWNDEIYSQLASVQDSSYREIFSGKLAEGNNFPFFYAAQKMIGQAACYQAGPLWTSQQTADRIVSRIQPSVCISLALALLFYFFVRYYSFPTGCLALFLSLSTSMTWQYWAEARPYALWFLLTTLQVLLAFYVIREKKFSGRACACLTAAHIGLAITIVLGLGQIAVVSVLLWRYIAPRRYAWLGLIVVPALLVLFYYSRSAKFLFWIDQSLEQYLRAGFSRDRFYVMFGLCVAWGLVFLKSKIKQLRFIKETPLKEVAPMLLLTVLMLSLAAVIYAVFRYKSCVTCGGFVVTTRYFVFLAPISIMATTVFLDALWRALGGNKLVLVFLTAGFGYLLIHRVFKILPDIRGYFPDFFL